MPWLMIGSALLAMTLLFPGDHYWQTAIGAVAACVCVYFIVDDLLVAPLRRQLDDLKNKVDRLEGSFRGDNRDEGPWPGQPASRYRTDRPR